MRLDLPIGNPISVEGSNLHLDNEFGFYYADIDAPIDLFSPVLPYKTSKGFIIYPTGSWSGWYFSEELKYARDHHGYKINLIKGYRFTPNSNLFNDYVNEF